MPGSDEETHAEKVARWAQAEADYASRHKAVGAPTAGKPGIRNADLVEAIAHVGALQEVLEQLEGGFESALSSRYGELVTKLTGCLLEQPEDQREYERHPVNVAIWSRSSELAGEFLVQLADAPIMYADELASRGARLLGDAREIRDRGSIGLKPTPEASRPVRPKSETRIVLDELLDRHGIGPTSARRSGLALIPGGAA